MRSWAGRGDLSGKTDRKLQDVVLARFQYRHEAEFAAGFLDDAQIAYRLQVDDAGMGMMISIPATLWVRGVDFRRAREILDLPQGDVPASGLAESSLPAPESREAVVRREEGRVVPVGDLTARERVVALAICVGTVGVGSLLAIDAIGPVWAGLTLAFAAAMGVSAWTGRAIPPIRRLLRALSGSAP